MNLLCFCCTFHKLICRETTCTYRESIEFYHLLSAEPGCIPLLLCARAREGDNGGHGVSEGEILSLGRFGGDAGAQACLWE